MSVESKEIAQQPSYALWNKALDAEKLWQAIVTMPKVDCVSTVNEVKELTARKSYQNLSQGRLRPLCSIVKVFKIPTKYMPTRITLQHLWWWRRKYEQWISFMG